MPLTTNSFHKAITDVELITIRRECDGSIQVAIYLGSGKQNFSLREFPMLKLYHTAISANSRRVWIALLEKEIPFELVSLKLDGDQFQPEFLAINPFHHIPVLVDDDFRLIESLAILDYLEAKYPTPAMLPTDAQDLATVRMVEMVTNNELLLCYDTAN